MSSSVATKPQWRGRPVPEEVPNHLEVVSTRSQRRARPRTVYAIITVATLVAIVVTQLLLSIVVSQGAYRIDSLQATQRTLQRNYQAASESLDRLKSPQNLATNAAALGMIPNTAPVYLRLSDGAVLGKPARAVGKPAKTSLVPNALLAGVPLVTKGTPSKAATVQSGQPGASKPAAPVGPVVLDGPLPSPTTH